ncbi:MAG: hypothetical protein AABW61_02405 [Candidatus Aenigmatarchaeota archaeon]
MLFGYLIGNRLAIGRDRRKEFIEGSKEFRTIFNQALVDIRDENIPFNLNSVRNGSLNKYEVAYHNFRHYLNWVCRNKYDEAWYQYSFHYKYEYNFDDSARKIVAKDIENLLKFPEYGFFKSMTFVAQHFLWKIRFKFFGLDKETKELIEKISKHDESPKK